MAKSQKPNKAAEQIGGVGEIRMPIWGGGVGCWKLLKLHVHPDKQVEKHKNKA